MKRALIVVLAVLLGLAAVVVWRASTARSHQIRAAWTRDMTADANLAAAHLSRAVTFRTVSGQDDGAMPDAEFEGLEQFLDDAYPRVHASLTKERVARHSLLYEWRGRDQTLKPLLLLAHLDVVPVEEGPGATWDEPPFSGRIANGFVWGRGSLDDKVAVIGILEAVEALLEHGYTPRRSVYLAFGEDEERGGQHGATSIARLLASRGVQVESLLDEGAEIDEGAIPGLAGPPALIAIAEKGQVNVELTVEARGGHSSTPPPQTAVGILSAAIVRLEAEQMKASLSGPTREALEFVGPELAFGPRLVMCNLWLFAPIVEHLLLADPGTAAMIRTTTAVTMVQGGVKVNVLPSRARAVVNFRIRPGDSVAGVLAHVANAVADPRVHLRAMAEQALAEPLPASSTASPAFRLLQTTIAQVFPDTIVAPMITPGGTDAHHYRALTANIYRFVPIRQGPSDFARWHGRNERLSVKVLGDAVDFYRQYIRNASE